MEVLGRTPPCHRRRGQIRARGREPTFSPGCGAPDRFQNPKDSLIGVALNWYVNLERGRIKTWRDLVEAFLK
ncbi:hypothetical protein CR513_05666, partial [Mucuna pruriens]